MDRINTLLTLSNEIISELEEYQRKYSAVDKELSEKYHYIELNKFNASQGYMELRSLQDILKRRREIKQHIARLSTVIDLTKLRQFTKSLKESANRIERREGE